jgi:hypothetical protein
LRIVWSFLFYQDDTKLSIFYRQLSQARQSRISKEKQNYSQSTNEVQSTINPLDVDTIESDISYDISLFYQGRAGLAALLKMVILCADLLKSRGLNVQEIDFMNYPVSYSRHRKWMGELNAWQYFFLQPSSLHVPSIGYTKYQRSLRLEMRKLVSLHPASGKRFSYFENKYAMNSLKDVFRNNIALNEIVTNCLDEIIKVLEFDHTQTLGVFFRGIPHINNPGHPISFNKEQVANELDKYLSNKRITNIFLSSHDTAAKHFISNRFSYQFNIVSDFRFKNRGPIAEHIRKKFKLEKGLPLDNLDYLLEIILLSRCKHFLGEIGNTSTVVGIASEAGQDWRVFSQGIH